MCRSTAAFLSTNPTGKNGEWLALNGRDDIETSGQSSIWAGCPVCEFKYVRFLFANGILLLKPRVVKG
jgi:hypothetical protein